MQIAIISNIRSNVTALKEVIKDIRNRDIEVVLNLGDMFYGDIEPRATYELIRENKFINICGNEDREILEASLDQLEKNPTLRYVYEDLGDEVLYWIQDLQFEKIIGETYYMIHGTYFDDTQCLLEKEIDGNNELRSDDEILKLTDNIQTPFIFCAQSSKPIVHKLKTGQVVISPGSIDIKSEEKTSFSQYSILTVEQNQYKVEEIKVVYEKT